MRTSNEPEALRNALLEKLCYEQDKYPGIETINDC